MQGESCTPVDAMDIDHLKAALSLRGFSTEGNRDKLRTRYLSPPDGTYY